MSVAGLRTEVAELMGRVVPAGDGMWRSAKSGGQFSDIANLSWAKSAVMEAAVRDLEWDRRDQDGLNSQETTGCCRLIVRDAA
jgi:hypothetical protein